MHDRYELEHVNRERAERKRDALTREQASAAIRARIADQGSDFNYAAFLIGYAVLTAEPSPLVQAGEDPVPSVEPTSMYDLHNVPSVEETFADDEIIQPVEDFTPPDEDIAWLEDQARADMQEVTGIASVDYADPADTGSSVNQD